MIPQTTELSQIQAAFIDKDNRIEELMRQINSAQSLLNSLKETTNTLVGNGKITIQTYGGSNVGAFTVNQKEDKTITLPQQATVNNGTLTIQKNGTSVETFTANQSGNTTANILVPTKTSELTNDSNYISDVNYVHTDNNFTSADKTKLDGIESGAEVNVQSDWNEVNDAADSYIKNKPTLALVATSGSYTDLSNKPTIPTAVSQLTNDSGFLTASTLPSMHFTYIVDSNTKLSNWANNTAGNDYTSVLIKKGSYSYNGAGVNLTAAGTKVVVGEPGNLLSFTRSHTTVNNNYGLYYNSTPMTSDYYIFGVKIQSAGYGFTRCSNLINCNSETFNASYFSCKFITNCYGKATGTGVMSNAFRESQFLVNCIGETTAFDWSGFVLCRDLNGCFVPNVGGSAYWGCQRISHCSSDANLRSNSFSDFIGCYSMSHCRAKTRISSSYASYTQNSTYAAADTANGGFNYIGSEINM